jgi:transposase-like protein
MSNPSYQRHSAEFREKSVAEFHQATLSGAVFCKQKGIAYASFCKWRHKLQSSAAQPEKSTQQTREQRRQHPQIDHQKQISSEQCCR